MQLTGVQPLQPGNCWLGFSPNLRTQHGKRQTQDAVPGVKSCSDAEPLLAWTGLLEACLSLTVGLCALTVEGCSSGLRETPRLPSSSDITG